MSKIKMVNRVLNYKMQKKLSPGAYRFHNVHETRSHAMREQTQPHGHAMVEQ